MYYDFDEQISRKQTSCFKWDGFSKYGVPEDAIPLWIADMDFKTPSCISDKIAKRACHPIYGYTLLSDQYFKAITSWLRDRHQWTIDSSWVVVTQNIMTAIKTTLNSFCQQDDYVLIQEPVYDSFKKSIIHCGLKPMINTLIYKENHYEVDWDHLALQLAHPQVKLFILCNPHNPVGKVWTKEELEKIATLCITHNVFIVSDEIHQDFVFAPAKHIPIASLSTEIAQHVVTCTSPAKIFNTPSISFANIIIPNPRLRASFEENLSAHWSGNASPFGQIVVEEGYTNGAPWVDALTTYLHDNKQYVIDFCAQFIPSIGVTDSDATYLLWLDVNQLQVEESVLIHDLCHQAKLWVYPGSIYGDSGQGFIRINIAIPRILLQEVLRRLATYCQTLS